MLRALNVFNDEFVASIVDNYWKTPTLFGCGLGR